MGYRKTHSPNPFNPWTFSTEFQINPSVQITRRFVVDKCNFGFAVISVKSGKKTEICDGLKTIANPQNQFILFNKRFQFFPQIISDFISQSISRASVISIRETSGK